MYAKVSQSAISDSTKQDPNATSSIIDFRYAGIAILRREIHICNADGFDLFKGTHKIIHLDKFLGVGNADTKHQPDDYCD